MLADQGRGADLADDVTDVDLGEGHDFVCDVNVRESFAVYPVDTRYITWDFHQMRVQLTHIAIPALLLLERDPDASEDGQTWSVLGRAGVSTCRGEHQRCYRVSQSVICRFVRLYPRYELSNRHERLCLSDVEFFGTLFM
jgi:hypothetical protein